MLRFMEKESFSRHDYKYFKFQVRKPFFMTVLILLVIS